MKYRVDHVTHVEYLPPVRAARFNLRLAPIDWPGQTITDFTLTVDPEPSLRETRPGPYPFNLDRVEIDTELDELTIRCRFVAVVEDGLLDVAGPDMTIEAVARAALAQDDLGPRSPVHYLYPSPLLPDLPEITRWAGAHLRGQAPAFEAGLALARAIQRGFVYDAKATEADTPVAQAFGIKRGVCQDFSHVLICAFRSVGLPAAYVSGYLRTTPPPGRPRLVGVDAMHAWVALWCGPQRGWVGLDPTNGCVAGSGHVVAAMGRDYADVSPIDGIFVGGSTQTIETFVDVAPIVG